MRSSSAGLTLFLRQSPLLQQRLLHGRGRGPPNFRTAHVRILWSRWLHRPVTPRELLKAAATRAFRQTAYLVLLARRSSHSRLVSTTFPRFSNELGPLHGWHVLGWSRRIFPHTPLHTEDSPRSPQARKGPVSARRLQITCPCRRLTTHTSAGACLPRIRSHAPKANSGS